MKTVGEIIHNERLKKEISLERLSHLTKIDVKYLEAIEKNDYPSLPSETFAKGFIRNIALRLDRNPDELVAIFRRDYRYQESVKLPKNFPKTRRQKLNLEVNYLLPYIFGFLIFVGYLWFQFRAVLTPPDLKIATPEIGSVITSPVEVSGETSVDSVVSLDDLKVRPDENGHFSAKVSLPLGETEVAIKSTNRFGRSTTKKINFTVISK